MKKDLFKNFKQTLIENEFFGDIQCAGYLWINCTDKQVEELKALAIKYAKEFVAYPDGRLKVGCYIFK